MGKRKGKRRRRTHSLTSTPPTTTTTTTTTNNNVDNVVASSSSSQSPSSTGPFSGLWEGLSPEVLASIFVRIPIDEMMRVMPFVCKSWKDVVAGPYCWSHIELERWCRRCNKTDVIDKAVRRLVRRSKGTCRFLSVFKLGDPGFSTVASCTKCLKVLKIPMSQASDKMVKRHVQSFKMLTVLDISYCLKITSDGLRALGNSCTSLVYLRRNIPPPGFDERSRRADDGEAIAIAETMPRIQQLELGFGRFTDLGLDAILTKCVKLTHLDIQGSYGVKMKGDLWAKSERLKVFSEPWVNDYENVITSDVDADAAHGNGWYFGSESE